MIRTKSFDNRDRSTVFVYISNDSYYCHFFSHTRQNFFEPIIFFYRYCQPFIKQVIHFVYRAFVLSYIAKVFWDMENFFKTNQSFYKILHFFIKHDIWFIRYDNSFWYIYFFILTYDLFFILFPPFFIHVKYFYLCVKYFSLYDKRYSIYDSRFYRCHALGGL